MFKIFFILFLCVAFTGCDQKTQARHYEEVSIKSPVSSMPVMANDPHAGLGFNIAMGGSKETSNSGLAWTVPDGWQESPGGGMRVATFKRQDDPQAIDVSIVMLGGAAGGLQANLTRWAGQIGLNLTQDQQAVSQWIDNAPALPTHGGSQAKFFDYTKLQKSADPSSKSMVASMIETADAIVFVKMTGTVKTVNENLESFKALTQSVRSK